MAIGKEISRRFGHLGINKILTIESSGIGIAAITALYFDLVPVVFAKKTQPNTMTEDFYGAGPDRHGRQSMRGDSDRHGAYSRT